MDIELTRYHVTQKVIWDTFIRESKNGLFFFERDYMDYHADRFTDHSLIFIKKDQIIAAFPANEIDKEIFSHSGLTYGSLVISEKTKTVEVLEIFTLLINYYKNSGFSKLLYKAIPSIFFEQPSQEDLYALFLNNAQLIRRDISSVLPIQNRLPLANSPARRYKKCSKLNLEIKENKNFENYWTLLTNVLASNHGAKPVHSLQEIQQLAEKFPNNIKLYEVTENEELLSGTLIFDFGKVLHTQYLANSEKGREIGALDYLIVKLLEEQFQDRPYFSFGISTENQGRFLNEGLINQKEMYGGRAICNDFYEITLN
ncbi:GNAT family N-acetyltransferase [Chryseobacterium sp. ISL-6]|uniref:GNAT family N-acetyltransferase n=1 Tax=Chryseobacterium sp. ISL-6 TaxID=2819143 RepID=UPI001BE8F821|nr:GNAT family N-acetyltransferase [Chryseobacterium sp. ISL-6]MBT2621807.1 GNAT family N-acetyltransferase [Chryseobacterium sp. ISL-6]